MSESPTRNDPQESSTPKMQSDLTLGVWGGTPKRIGQYALLGKIGHGGMGTVYKAFHTSLKRVVALKFLPPERVHDPQLLARFRREMEAVGKLDHPNIVRATDAGEENGLHFLVMEFMDGPDLSRLVQLCGPLPVADAGELVRQAALGLQCAYEHGLVHRDVKPSNLVLGPGGCVKVLDLGLARLQDEVSGEELTDTGQVMGTADYMAPEQAEGGQDVDIRADIYALGCTLYKFLAGRPPFGPPKYNSRQKKIRAHVEDPPPPIRDQCPDVPQGIVSILDRMLAKSPSGRYATPAEVAAALEPFAAQADLCALFETARARQGPSPPISELHDNRAGSSAPTTETAFHGPAGLASETQTPTLPYSQRRNAPVIITSAIVFCVALVTLAIGIPWLFGLPVIPTKPTRPDPPAGEGLLAQDPTVIVWPRSSPGRNSNFRIDSDRQTLTVNCDSLGMLQLGTATETEYKITVGIEQSGWHGGVGVFFGLHESAKEGKPCLEFQRIELVEVPNEPFVLRRTVGWIVVEGTEIVKQGSETVEAQQVRPLHVGEHLLEITVGKDGLERVRWAGEDLNKLVAPELNNGLGPDAFRGPFGTFHQSNAGIFHNPRFVPLTRDEQ